MTVTEKALQWMIDLANDQTHGYSQASRWGPDYDCSSAVITAWQTAGVPVKTKGATYTGNMKAVFLSCGFKDVTAKVNLSTCSGMVKGDVLLNEVHHTAMYCGNKQIVHARGQSYGSPRTGDQGTEIAITAYYNYPWNCVLRYDGSAEPVQDDYYYVGSCFVKLGEMVIGCYGPQVKTVQRLLNAKGYKGKDGKKLDVDGEFGENTAYAVECLQKDAGMSGIFFGSVSSATWFLLID